MISLDAYIQVLLSNLNIQNILIEEFQSNHIIKYLKNSRFCNIKLISQYDININHSNH